jgi:exodeoxyribonuclease VII small subunit
MEDGSLPLKDALTNYQRGAFLLAFCRKTLNDAQQEVRILEDGMTKPFSAASDDE